jgi:hypothetical protein
MTLVVDRLFGHEDEATDDVLHLDRRRAQRVPQDRPVKVYEPAASRFFGGRTVDVSSTGLQLEFPSFVQLRPGRVINVHIGIAEGGQPLANRRSMIPARVVWLRHDEGDDASRQNLLRVGVEFLTHITANAA